MEKPMIIEHSQINILVPSSHYNVRRKVDGRIIVSTKFDKFKRGGVALSDTC